jgi:hypothetical protein
MESPNTKMLSVHLLTQGNAAEAIQRSFRTFNAWAEPFRNAESSEKT